MRIPAPATRVACVLCDGEKMEAELRGRGFDAGDADNDAPAVCVVADSDNNAP